MGAASLRNPPAVKLIIQIPCLNEEQALPVTLADLPRSVPGFDVVEWLVIDDGSTDRTIEVARAHGVDHIVRLTNNKGLAQGFQAGLDASLKLGADVIVNTDADNQYNAADIPKLVAPIVRGDADLVIGDREVTTIEHFSRVKKWLQRLGSWVVRQASDTTVPDTTSGFRAYNREAALQVQVVSRFTYTLETVIQAGKMLVAIDHVPIRTNPKMRESRLFASTWSYVRTNAASIFRIYSQYEPLRVFLAAAAVVGLAAMIVWGRFAVLFISGQRPGPRAVGRARLDALRGRGQLAALGVIGDLLAANRVLIQRTMERTRRIELKLGVEPSHYEPAERRTGHAPGRRETRPPACRRRAAAREALAAAASTTAVPTGNTYDKYGSTNPVVRRLMARFEARHGRASRGRPPGSILDVGCGEGVLTEQWAQASTAASSESISTTPSSGGVGAAAASQPRVPHGLGDSLPTRTASSRPSRRWRSSSTSPTPRRCSRRWPASRRAGCS